MNCAWSSAEEGVLGSSVCDITYGTEKQKSWPSGLLFVFAKHEVLTAFIA